MHLVPILLKRMVYSEQDRILMSGEEEDDQHVPDRQQDIKPRFHTARHIHITSSHDQTHKHTRCILLTVSLITHLE